LLYLAAAGIGRIGIVDNDQVEKSNLQRQIIHETNAIGNLKINWSKDDCEVMMTGNAKKVFSGSMIVN